MRHNPRRAIIEDSDRMPRPILSGAARQKTNGICSERGSCHAPTRTARCATLNNRRPPMGGLFALSLELFSHFYLVPSFCLADNALSKTCARPTEQTHTRSPISSGMREFQISQGYFECTARRRGPGPGKEIPVGSLERRATDCVGPAELAGASLEPCPLLRLELTQGDRGRA